MFIQKHEEQFMFLSFSFLCLLLLWCFLACEFLVDFGLFFFFFSF